MAFLRKHPHIGICGTFATTFGEKKPCRWSYPCAAPEIKVKLLFECSFVHSSVMMRRDLLEQYGLKYNPRLQHSYDWELWQKAAQNFDLANIPKYLIKYRVHDQSVSAKTLDMQIQTAKNLDDVSLRQLNLEHHPLRQIHRDTAFETLNIKNRGKGFLDQVNEWFRTLQEANRTYPIYNEEALDRFLKKRMFIVLTNNTQHPQPAAQYFFKKKLYLYISWMWSLKFILKIGLSSLRPPKMK